jgi:predicted transglutaminase-like cysteine proteinase
MIVLATVLALGSTALSAAAFGPPPPAPRIGVGTGDGQRGGGFGGSYIGVSPIRAVSSVSHGKDPVFHHRSKTDGSEVSAKWEDLRSRMRTEEQTIASCRSDIGSCPEAARRFLEIVELGRQREGRARLGEINRAVNLRIKPADDWFLYGVDDFWSAPLATLGVGAGDCEDYAILKYAALRELGVALDDMRIIIVRDTRRRTNHAVLAVRDDKQWLILDNRTFVMAKVDDVRHYFFLVILDQGGTRFEGVAFRD